MVACMTEYNVLPLHVATVIEARWISGHLEISDVCIDAPCAGEVDSCWSVVCSHCLLQSEVNQARHRFLSHSAPHVDVLVM